MIQVNSTIAFNPVDQMAGKARPFRKPKPQEPKPKDLSNISTDNTQASNKKDFPSIIQNHTLEEIPQEREITKVDLQDFLDQGLISNTDFGKQEWPSILEVVVLTTALAGSIYGVTQAGAITALVMPLLRSFEMPTF